MPSVKKKRAQPPPRIPNDRELHPDADAAHLFIIQMGLLTNEMQRNFSRKVGISSSRMELLDAVYHAGEISQTELTKQLSMDAALVTRFVKQMEVEGLLARRVDPADNRFTLVSLGPGAPAAFDRMVKLGQEYQERLFKDVPEQELQRSIRLLKRIRENLNRLEQEE